MKLHRTALQLYYACNYVFLFISFPIFRKTTHQIKHTEQKAQSTLLIRGHNRTEQQRETPNQTKTDTSNVITHA